MAKTFRSRVFLSMRNYAQKESEGKKESEGQQLGHQEKEATPCALLVLMVIIIQMGDNSKLRQFQKENCLQKSATQMRKSHNREIIKPFTASITF